MNSNLPNKLSIGDPLPAHWLNRLLDWLRSRDLQVGPGLRMSRTPSGTTLSLAPGARRPAMAAGAAVPARVRRSRGSTGRGGVVNCEFYADGTGAPATGTGSVFLTGASPGQAIDGGTWLLAFPVAACKERLAEEEAT